MFEAKWALQTLADVPISPLYGVPKCASKILHTETCLLSQQYIEVKRIFCIFIYLTKIC